jgi:glycosyltransferase involved in cell wall biosynthesis
MLDASALAKAGFMVTVVDFQSDRTRPAEEDIGGVHFKHIFMPGYFTPVRFKPWYLVKLVMMMVYGTIQLLQVHADIYHGHQERALAACYIAARVRNKPFIVDTPELLLTDPRYASWPRLQKLAIWFLRGIIKHRAGYITGSPLYPQEIRSLYHAQNITLVRHVPPYQEISKSDRLLQHLKLRPEVKIALYQGHLVPDRQLERLIQAAVFLEQDIIIVLLGSGPEKTVAELKSLITLEKVSDRVKMIPAVPYEELLKWTASADIGLTAVAPDQSLNTRLCLPNKFFEYLMAGLPVLSLQYDAIAEVIKKYEVGKVLSSLAHRDIGIAINEMLADPEGLAQMKSNALAAAKQEFYWEKESQKLIHLYEEILSKRKGL